MSNSLDFQALLSTLRAKPQESTEQNSSIDTFNPSFFGAARDPPTLSNAPNTSKLTDRTVTSPATEAIAPSNATAQGLLSLLNFGQQGASKENPRPVDNPLIRSISENAAAGKGQEQQSSAMSASDLVARFMSSTPKGEANRLPFATPHESFANQKIDAPSPSASQDALLRLLNRSSSSSARSAGAGAADNKSQLTATGRPARPSTESKEGRDSPIRLFGSAQSRESTPFELPKFEEVQEVPSSKPIFTYKNPFEALNASRNQTPQPASPAGQPMTQAMKAEYSNADEAMIGEEGKSFDTPQAQTSTRRKLTPKIPLRLASASKEETETAIKGNELDLSSKPTAAVLDPTSDRAVAVESPPVMDAQEAREGRPEGKSNGMKRKPGSPSALREEERLPAAKTEQAEAADGWESVDESPVTKPTKREVPVYNFPIKPFVSITIQPSETSAVGLRADGIMEISRLKKEFDQIDRSLASATVKYISYALVKNGGLRIIRQDDGVDRQVFKNSHDRIFNVTFCSTAINALPTNDQAVLGTGVSGAVYYATVSKEGNDLFEQSLLDSESLIFPPFPLGDENVAGGALKTRAKRSSRHPEFFGIGRGKTIQIVWPATALSSKYGISATNRKVDVEKLFKDRSLRITTGKAGKDFAFSEDDSVIVSLDKLGRMRFWDIRPLVDEENATAGKVSPVNVDTPVLTLSTASPSEKSWPTSVMFVDKPRPYAKGGSLRYVLVGMRQNHTLQLWDLALGKAVQEINFPHESESDGICSINYHPNSAIIVVGHPTRNSLYFIHLSAPRYTLAPTSQAAFISGIAVRDPSIPKPDTTACMSGLREISFADKGHLRSVELLPVIKPTESSKTPSATQSLFELYVVHSKGVTCLSITKEDLGWSAESKVVKPVDAVAEGVIALKDFRLGSFVDESAGTRSQSEDAPVPAKALKKKLAAGLTRPSDDFQVPKEKEPEASSAQEALSFTNGSAADQLPIRETSLPKESKKQKKKQAATPSATNPATSNSRAISPTKATPSESLPPAAILIKSSTMGPPDQAPVSQSTSSAADPRSQLISGDSLDKHFKKIESGISAEFRKELEKLYQNFHTDRNVQDSAASARQEAMLRIISTSLSSNVEASMSRIISAQMQQVVAPAVTGVTVQAVTTQVGEAIARVLHQLVPHELGTQMPVAINTALQNPQITRAIAEAVSQKVSAQIERQIVDSLQKSILPLFKNLAHTAAEKAAADVEKRMGPQVRQLEADRQADLTKIDKLSLVMQGMAETMQAMSDSQVAFQSQILRDRRQFSQQSEATPTASSRQVSTARQPTPLSAAPLPKPPANHAKSKEQIEYDDINRLMAEGKYEQGSIRWLQSPQPVELFDNLFVRFTPDYLTTDVSPLVAFSVAITVANSLSTNTVHRIDWINTAFSAVDLNDPEIADLSEHAPALLSSLIQKLDTIDSQAAGGGRDERLLQAVAGLSMRARSMRSELVGHGRQRSQGAGYNHNYGQLDA